MTVGKGYFKSGHITIKYTLFLPKNKRVTRKSLVMLLIFDFVCKGRLLIGRSLTPVVIPIVLT